jgi:hypothetical protein
MIMEREPEGAESNATLAYMAFVAMFVVVLLMLVYARFN